MGLADNKCIDRGGMPPLEAPREQELLKQLRRGWELNGQAHLERLYTFKGVVAEAEGHHPDLYLGRGTYKIEIRSHKMNGLKLRAGNDQKDFFIRPRLVAERLLPKRGQSNGPDRNSSRGSQKGAGGF